MEVPNRYIERSEPRANRLRPLHKTLIQATRT